MRTEKFILPSHWAAYFVNGDESGYWDRELAQINQFENYMCGLYGACHCVDVAIDFGDDFRKYHDAMDFGVLATNVVEFTFDISDNK